MPTANGIQASRFDSFMSPSPIKAPLKRLIVNSLAGFLRVELSVLGKLSAAELEQTLALRANQLLPFIRHFEGDQNVDILDDESADILEQKSRELTSETVAPSSITQLLAELEPVKQLMRLAMVPLKPRVKDEKTLIENYENERVFGEYRVSSSASMESFSTSSISEIQPELPSLQFAFQSADVEPAGKGRQPVSPYHGGSLLDGLSITQSPVKGMSPRLLRTLESPTMQHASDIERRIEALENVIAQKEQQLRSLRQSHSEEQQRLENEVSELLLRLQDVTSRAERSEKNAERLQLQEQRAREESADALAKVEQLSVQAERHNLQARKYKTELQLREQANQQLEQQTAELQTRNAQILQTMKALDTWAKGLIGEKDAEIHSLNEQLQNKGSDSRPFAAVLATASTQTSELTPGGQQASTAPINSVDRATVTEDDLLGYNPIKRIQLLESQVSMLKQELEQAYKAYEAASASLAPSSEAPNAKGHTLPRLVPQRNVFKKLFKLFLVGCSASGVALLYTVCIFAIGACAMSLFLEFFQVRVAPHLDVQESVSSQFYYFNTALPKSDFEYPSTAVDYSELHLPEFFELRHQAEAQSRPPAYELGIDDSPYTRLTWRPSFLSKENLNSIFDWFGEPLAPLLYGDNARGTAATFDYY